MGQRIITHEEKNTINLRFFQWNILWKINTLRECLYYRIYSDILERRNKKQREKMHMLFKWAYVSWSPPLQIQRHQWFLSAVEYDRLFEGGKALAPNLSLDGVWYLTERAWLMWIYPRDFLNS